MRRWERDGRFLLQRLLQRLLQLFVRYNSGFKQQIADAFANNRGHPHPSDM